MSRRKTSKVNVKKVGVFEHLEPRNLLSIFGWISSAYDTYVAPTVQNTANVVSSVVKTVEDVGSNIHKTIDAITPVIPSGSSISNSVNVIAGIYDGAKNIVVGAGTVVADAVSVTPIAIVVAPDHAKEVAQKWTNVAATVVTNPGVLVDAVVDQYKQEYNTNGVGGVIGMGIVDVGSFLVGAGEAKAVAKGGEIVADVSRVSKVAEASSAVSKAEKLTVLTGEIDAKTGQITSLAAKASNANLVLDKFFGSGLSMRELLGEGTFVAESGVVKKIPGAIHTTVNLVDGTAHVTTRIDNFFGKGVNFAEHVGANGVTSWVKENAVTGSKVIKQLSPKTKVFEEVKKIPAVSVTRATKVAKPTMTAVKAVSTKVAAVTKSVTTVAKSIPARVTSTINLAKTAVRSVFSGIKLHR